MAISSLVRRQPHIICNGLLDGELGCNVDNPPSTCSFCDQAHQRYPSPEKLAPMGEEIWLKIANDRRENTKRYYAELERTQEFCEEFGINIFSR